MNQNRSVATIEEPEFINIQPYNPLISQCEIKVLYLGQNRNHSYIDKNTAIQMANSLPGTPIVGAYRKDVEDFGDHGHIIHIENGEITFSCKTVPYGFVAPDAQVWFKKFIDTDSFGNEIEREYLMTTGYLWTGQYEEAMKAIQEGKGQSMELDEASLNGKWETDNRTGMEFFIINDAIFSKLCILGDDVEPCFEGAAVTAQEVSSKFSYKDFSTTLFTMMNELKEALRNKGGLEMPNEFTDAAVDNSLEETIVEEPTATFADEGGEEVDAGADTETNSTEGDSEEGADTDEPVGDDNSDTTEEEVVEDDDDEGSSTKKRKFTLTEEEYTALKAENDALKQELAELKTFKLEIENQKKDALINQYYMLSDEDKADIIAHKSEYSLEEIESKLAVIYVKKNVNFSMNEENEEEDDPSTTFSLEDTVESVPAIVEALRNIHK